jgi:drug/metabolite transporter (DMT)-like permease
MSKFINWLLFLALSIIWGSSFILMKHSKEELSAPQIGALRIFTAGVVFLPLAVFIWPKFRGKKILIIILSGVTGNLLPAFLFASAIARILTAHWRQYLIPSPPFFVVLIALVIFRDKIKTQKIIGVLIGFVGLTLLFLLWKGVSFENFKYALLILLATRVIRGKCKCGRPFFERDTLAVYCHNLVVIYDNSYFMGLMAGKFFTTFVL